jgi:propanediol dehydratase small subunit
MNSSDYPLSEKRPDLLKSPSGIPFADLTLEAARRGALKMDDLRVTSEALELQAQIAGSAGRRQLAENLRRAAELVGVPDAEILEIYGALRPGRADRAELLRRADHLEERYGARRCAALIREAAEAYSATQAVRAPEHNCGARG